MRAGADTGGTFTDVLMVDGERLIARKVPSTPDDPARALLDSLASLARPPSPQTSTEGAREAINLTHSTTVATNAVLERRGGPVALVTTAGFEDVIELGRQARPQLYALHPGLVPPLVDAAHRLGVAERVGADGVVYVPLSDEEVARVVDAVVALGVAGVAVCLLHGYVYPAHERRLGAALQARGLWVSLSSTVSPLPREYERASTTVIDAWVRPLMTPYLQQLSSLGSVSVLRSGGGALTALEAAARPVETVLSGPAAGVAGAAVVARRHAIRHAMTFDMGGTSTDLALLVDGMPAIADEGVIGGLPLSLSMLAVHTIGAGGGSLARVDTAGALKVGPESAGATPGPAAYGNGGAATVTDALLALGHLPQFLDGERQLSTAAANAALRALGLATASADATESANATESTNATESQQAAAASVVAVCVAQIERAMRSISVERGLDPAELVLMPFGGAGPMLAVALARALGMRRVLVPSQPGLLCAYGALSSSLVREEVVPLGWIGHAFDVDKESTALSARLAQPGFTVEVAALVRYRGQGASLQLLAGGNLANDFIASHQRRYGYVLAGRELELTSLRGRASGPLPSLPELGLPMTSGPVGTCQAWFDGQELRTLQQARSSLSPGRKIEGPAILTEYSSTVVLPPGAVAVVLSDGSLDIAV